MSLTFAPKDHVTRELHHATGARWLTTRFVNAALLHCGSQWLVVAFQHEGRDEDAVACEATDAALTRRQWEGDIQHVQISEIDHQDGIHLLNRPKGAAGADAVHKSLCAKMVHKHGAELNELASFEGEKENGGAMCTAVSALV